jgi:hypothetical protein
MCTVSVDDYHPGNEQVLTDRFLHLRDGAANTFVLRCELPGEGRGIDVERQVRHAIRGLVDRVPEGKRGSR